MGSIVYVRKEGTMQSFAIGAGNKILSRVGKDLQEITEKEHEALVKERDVVQAAAVAPKEVVIDKPVTDADKKKMADDKKKKMDAKKKGKTAEQKAAKAKKPAAPKAKPAEDVKPAVEKAAPAEEVTEAKKKK